MNYLLLRRHLDNLLAMGLFTAVLAVYLRTLCPTLYWGDSGEMAAVAAVLGVPHPTGYPLYCLFGHVWTLIFPFGSIVWRLNVLSAIFGSLAVVCLYGFARTIRLPRPLALMAGGLLAFSFTFWQQSLITETYSLAALCTCLLLFLAARWHARGCRNTDLTLLAVAYGFALTCHQTNTLFLPGFLAFILWSAPHLSRLRERAVRGVWARALGLGALPLLSYLYLPLRARAHAACNWGDPETLFAFYYHVTGRAYAGAMFHPPPGFALYKLLSWATSELPGQFPWLLVAFAGLGLICFWLKAAERPLALLLTWILLSDIGFVSNYPIYNGYIYYIPSYVVLSACAGRGLLGLWQATEPRLAISKRPAFAMLGAFCVLAIIPMQAAAHRHVDLSHNWTCYDYGRNLLASVPAQGLLIVNDDDTASASMTYLQTVEGYRPDVVVVWRGRLQSVYDPKYQNWVNAWYLEALGRTYPEIKTLYPGHALSAEQALTEDPLRRLIRDAVAKKIPVCALAPAETPDWFTPPQEFPDDDGRMVRFDTYLSRHYATSTLGLVTLVMQRGQKLSLSAQQAQTAQVWRSYSLRGVFEGSLQDDKFLAPLALDYANGELARARLARAQNDFGTAETAYSHVLALFTCDEAAQGLQRCQQARQTAKAS